MRDFFVGAIVVNLTSEVAKVVDFHKNGNPILRALTRTLRPKGGKWLADPNKTRVLSEGEIAAFRMGGVITR